MDPKLQELVLPNLDPDEEIEAIIRVRETGAVPNKVRVISTFGDVLTCRIKRADVAEVYASPLKISLKAARYYAIDPIGEVTEAVVEAVHPFFSMDTDEINRDVDAAGQGVAIGIIDWGMDFAHPDFLNPNGTTRLLALWDQSVTLPFMENQPYGYGTVFNRALINQALQASTPYQSLGYHPANGDPIGIGAHGTHVASIAAGAHSLAPRAEIIFVHLSARDTSGTAHLGDSVRILEAIDFVRQAAAGRPLAINMSVGRHGAPKDGTTLVERAIDNLLSDRPNTMLCQSAGNYYQAKAHTSGRVVQGKDTAFRFRVSRADRTPNELEIWYSGKDKFGLQLRNLETGLLFSPVLGGYEKIEIDGSLIGRVYHREHDPNNGKNHIDLFLYPNAPPGKWEVALHGSLIEDGHYHGWIERDGACRGCQAVFDDPFVNPRYTIGSLASTRHSLVVGAFNSQSPHFALAPFSSMGPTTDGRTKPDLVAPGVNIPAARSAPLFSARPVGGLTNMSGTSMAAPHVTGACALLLEVLPANIPFSVIRNFILENTDPVPADISRLRVGAGVLNVAKAFKAAAAYSLESRQLPDISFNTNEQEMETETIQTMASSSGSVTEFGEIVTRIGQISLTGGQAWRSIYIDRSMPLQADGSLEDALRFAVRTPYRHFILSGNLFGNGTCSVFRYQQEISFLTQPVIIAEFQPDIAGLVLNGQDVYFPENPLRRSNRWLLMPDLKAFFQLDPQDQARQRNRWIRQLNQIRNQITIPGQTVNQSWLQNCSTPSLRLLLINWAEQALRVQTQLRHGADRGGVVFGITLPPMHYPLIETDCYLAVIAAREGMMETINAWDHKAGISIGPVQINAIRGSILRFLYKLWEADRVLFDREFGQPFEWTMRWDTDHPVLMVRSGHSDGFELIGLNTHEPNYRREYNRTYAYFQSGNPSRQRLGQINPAFRRRLAGAFRNTLTYPHVQQLVIEVSRWFLEPGLRMVHQPANRIPPLDTRNPDRDTFILKSLLFSAYVRFSGCLDPFLAALRPYPTIAEKLSNWENALNQLSDACQRLRDRLRRQVREAGVVFDLITRMRLQQQAQHEASTLEQIDPFFQDNHFDWEEEGWANWLDEEGDAFEIADAADSSISMETLPCDEVLDTDLSHFSGNNLEAWQDAALLFDSLATGQPSEFTAYEIVALPDTPVPDHVTSDTFLITRAYGEGGVAFLEKNWVEQVFNFNESKGYPEKLSTLGYNQLLARPAQPNLRNYVEVNPDSPLVPSFVQAHSSRFCSPGQAGSTNCHSLSAPRPIRRVVIHALAVAPSGSLSGVQQIVRNWQRPGRQASAHYLVDRDGTITQMVTEANVAFHVGNPAGNRDSIGIEHADVCNDPAPLTTILYEKSAELIRDIARRHGFAPGPRTVVGHSSIGAHRDPGPYWDWEYYYMLLRWDGITPSLKPLRFVQQSTQLTRPQGWRLQRRRNIPDSHCASNRDSYGATYFTSRPNPGGNSVEFSIVINESGYYSVSLWWPRVTNANPRVNVEVIVRCLQSPCPDANTQRVEISQQRNFGRWIQIGRAALIQNPPVEIRLRISSNSSARGLILADSIRVMRVGNTSNQTTISFQSSVDNQYLPEITSIEYPDTVPSDVCEYYRVQRQRWVQVKQDIVRIAQDQYSRIWNNGTNVERNPAMQRVIQDYWLRGPYNGVAIPSNINIPTTPWSAAFISWVINRAGGGDKFSKVGNETNYRTTSNGYRPVAHWRYVAPSKINRQMNSIVNPIYAYNINEVRPQVGDIVVKSRGHSSATYGDHVNRLTHGDIVVSVNSDSITVIGGNSGPNSNTVFRRNFPLDASGFVQSTGGRNDDHFAIVRINTTIYNTEGCNP
ncbi:MAG: DUF2272 domain-containing protein [Lewinellaceae bacterium]|nr:DUF2272 domain-containing protein [Lewinellaceae bacterium]